MNRAGALYGSGYVVYSYGKKSHLCVSDKKNYRVSFCGLRYLRHGTEWKRSTWEGLSLTSRVTCRKCIEVLAGSKTWEDL